LLVTRRRCSLFRFSCVAYRVCRWRRGSLSFARYVSAALISSLLLRCKRRVPVASSVPSLRSSHGGVAHCFASNALQTACAGGAVGPFASLVTGRRRSLLRFSCVAYRVCLRRRQSPRFARHTTALLIVSLFLRCIPRVPEAPSFPCFARHMTASLVTSLLLRCKRRVPVAPSVPSLRSSHDGVAHCSASLALQTACACGAVGPFASLVT
jgi:hypothetical protein